MTAESIITPDMLRETVRTKYAERALLVNEGRRASCCDSLIQEVGANWDPITGNLYGADEAAELPEAAVLASLGCGNPTALAALKAGETVLDLGSGGGIDVLLSAKRVGPDGFAYGLDMTDEMLDLAERNRIAAGAENVKFLKGHIEAIPLPDHSVDVIISNCVINLSSDKGQVLREAFRVLKPGGRFAVSDVVTKGALPADLQKDMEAWVGCIAGALEEDEYRRLLADAGFREIDIEHTRVYDPRELAASVSGELSSSAASCCGGGTVTAPVWDESAFGRFEASGGLVAGAFVRAVKPGA
ncbi:MAG: arsenite methyltransferase [Thermomicrobiales bacterium]